MSASLSLLQGKTASYAALGCKLSYAETASILDALVRAGAVAAAPSATTDILLVGTCSVTDTSDRKSRQAIRRFRRLCPRALIVVTGCYAQLAPRSIAALPGVSLVIGSQYKDRVPLLIADRLADPAPPCRVLATPLHEIRSFQPALTHQSRTRSFLKVQDGCDYYCTYCTVPLARGRSRSAPIATLLEQARLAIRQGAREIVLTGVNIGDFGKPRGETLLELLRRLDALPGVERYRVSSLEPDLLTDDILRFLASSPHFMPHFHLPLQSGSDAILRLMRRRYTTDYFLGRVRLIRHLLPHAFIGVDVIAGSRGETPELFQESLRFISRLPFSRLHVFPYSERRGTRALSIPYVVSPEEKRRRALRLRRLSEGRLREFYSRFLGTVRPVLVERAAGREPSGGFTDNYIRVVYPSDLTLPDNRIVPTLLRSLSPDRSRVLGIPQT